MRTFRHTRLLAAAIGTALAILTLTGCEDGMGTRDEGPAQSAKSAPSASYRTTIRAASTAQ